MKIINSILSLFVIGLLSSCSSTQDLSYEDDIYSEEEEYIPTASSTSEFDEYYSYDDEASAQTKEEDYYDPKHSEIENNDGSNTYVTNNYYNSNYDYQYSSQIRRFNNCNSGYSYYNPYYTNSNYYGSSYGWNTSIYFGNYYSGYANNSYYNNGMGCCSNNSYWNNYGNNNYGYSGYGNGYYGNGYGNSSNSGNYYGDQTASNSHTGNHGGGMSSNSLTGSNYGNSSSEDYNTVTAVVKKINPTINMNGSGNSNNDFTATTSENTSMANSKEIGDPNLVANATKAPSYNNSISSLSNNSKFENHNLNSTIITPAQKENSNYISREPASTNNSRGTSSAWNAKPNVTNRTNSSNGGSSSNKNNFTRPNNAALLNNSYSKPSTTNPSYNIGRESPSTYQSSKSSNNIGTRSNAGSSSPSGSNGNSSGSNRSKGSSSSSKSGGRR